MEPGRVFVLFLPRSFHLVGCALHLAQIKVDMRGSSIDPNRLPISNRRIFSFLVDDFGIQNPRKVKAGHPRRAMQSNHKSRKFLRWAVR